jgi:hypothetical protein
MMQNPQERMPAVRGDSFDVGQPQQAQVLGPKEQDQLDQLLQNPNQVARMLGITEQQARNVKSAIIGAGTGYIHNRLAPLFGDDIAAALGGYATSFITRKLIELTKGR